MLPSKIGWGLLIALETRSIGSPGQMGTHNIPTSTSWVLWQGLTLKEVSITIVLVPLGFRIRETLLILVLNIFKYQDGCKTICLSVCLSISPFITGWGHSTVVKCLLRMHEAVGSIPSRAKNCFYRTETLHIVYCICQFLFAFCLIYCIILFLNRYRKEIGW